MKFGQLHRELQTVLSTGSVEVRPHEFADDVELTDVVHDSRAARPSSLFCAAPGLITDGHDFVDAAVTNGAAGLLVERWVDADVPQIKVDSTRVAMPHAAAAVHHHPSREVKVFGITGTNGKTTTTQLLADIANEAGHPCAVVGTLAGSHTTPESTELQRRLRSLATSGTEMLALEVSSHALDQHRVDATEFTVAAFSNLTADHLDYHGDMDRYFEAKKALFDGRSEFEVISIDDPWGAQLADERRNAHTVSIHDVETVRETIFGTDFVWRGHSTHVSLPGPMNVANALMAAESAVLLGIDEALVAQSLKNAKPVPGRMERVRVSSDTEAANSNPTVVVDYSHTPDSIDRALATLRTVASGARLSIVFGCGGDRDRLKRPLMARAAEAGADRVYLTNDNPRSEDPVLIIADAVAGLTRPNDVVVEPDRSTAIKRAIIEAGPDDVVLIAGKGHEKTQTIGSDVLPFDDVDVARRALEGAAS